LRWEEEVEAMALEEVEATGLEEDLDEDGGQDSEEEEDEEEEEGHEEREVGTRGTRMVRGCTARGWGDRSASEPPSSHRVRTSHLVHPPVAPHEENMVVIIPSGDG
jgi:hypothetical protein